jgi:hypothetical protein
MAFFASSYPQLLPASIQALRHWRLFSMFAGVVSFKREAILISDIYGDSGSLVRSARRSSSPPSLILTALDLSFWDMV